MAAVEAADFPKKEGVERKKSRCQMEVDSRMIRYWTEEAVEKNFLTG